MIPAISGSHMMPEYISLTNSNAALGKVNQGQEISETAVQRVAELNNNGEQTESKVAPSVATSGTLGRNIDIKA
ncbi:hypothetical protein [Desulfitobacterium metallireducens]|uniref:Uncharacterized protein n=1 Tax=Desulfitobacterium metallireducens DSM 15288 TaxID=871968 RepID=W0EHJ7_9FIRM|nr:hypothetical protein [Desulfitobacterium metallireducens]AHF08659.1 hypothetical protein DESME_12975 [Desulfitobacterium metallireducens DSM 15288]